MATSGTTAFNLELIDVIEEAGERCGVEIRAGNQVRTARRSLNLLLMEWANRGINLWTIEKQEVLLPQGVEKYVLPADTVDIFEAVIRTGIGPASQTDLILNRISAAVYATIPNKLSPGRPYQMWIDRQPLAPVVVLWPVPNLATYTMVYWRLRRMQDAGTGLNTQDIPFRFLPALIAGLAYHMAMKFPEGLARLDTLKAQYDEAWTLASDEDREKAPTRLVPRMFHV